MGVRKFLAVAAIYSSQMRCRRTANSPPPVRPNRKPAARFPSRSGLLTSGFVVLAALHGAPKRAALGFFLPLCSGMRSTP